MSTRLVILGLLNNRELHGYELKRLIEQYMGDWTSIAFGSIYFALGKLADEGLIEKSAVEKHQKRPSRSIYRITESGKAEFDRLLHELWEKKERQFFSFDIALFFLSHLEMNDAVAYLEKRLADVEGDIRYLKKHKKETELNPYVPKLASAIMDHSLSHLAAEKNWLGELLKNCQSGKLV